MHVIENCTIWKTLKKVLLDTYGPTTRALFCSYFRPVRMKQIAQFSAEKKPMYSYLLDY